MMPKQSGGRRAGLLMAAGWLVALLPQMAAEAAESWGAIAEKVIVEVDKAESLGKVGKGDDAKEAAITAYFGVFEEERMEIAERQALGAKHVAEIEDLFNALRKAAGSRPDLHAEAEALRRALRADGKALDAAKVVVGGTP